MKFFLTLCFYEHPAAKVHIDFWEAKMREMSDRTLFKIDSSKTKVRKVLQDSFDDVLFYILKKIDGYTEILYCVRLGSIPDLSFLYKNIRHLEEKEEDSSIVYIKSLIFGKVTEEDLVQVNEFMKKVKEFFIERLKLSDIHDEHPEGLAMTEEMWDQVCH